VIEVRPGRPGWAEVTFRHPCDQGQVAVTGEFNQWQTDALPLTPGDDGFHTATVEVPVGRRYRFRYVLDDDRWENDWGADAYVPNEFGGDDSVLDLRHDGPHGDRLGITDSRTARRQRSDDSPGRNTTM
jgi:1,4-alpha-glucan branching enzyme